MTERVGDPDEWYSNELVGYLDDHPRLLDDNDGLTIDQLVDGLRALRQFCDEHFQPVHNREQLTDMALTNWLNGTNERIRRRLT